MFFDGWTIWQKNIKMAAVDIDGTFVRSDYTYDVPHFKRILSHMKKEGCNFVEASGNQYYQLRDLFLDIMRVVICG